MNISRIYRKRIIPAECILLKDDIIVSQDKEIVVTKWNTLNPKTTLSHGFSCYFLTEGIKVSKMYRSDNTLLYRYCDIMEFGLDAAENALIATDLLADVVILPEGGVEVVDLDELAEAMERNLITKEQMTACLRSLDHLLSLIYRDKFDRLLAPLDTLGL